MDNFGRPNWDHYYLMLAHIISSKSIDPNTRHGCVLVSKDNRVLSTGYNGPLKGVDDSKIPLERPLKYFHLLHAEENALLSYNGSCSDISDATCYVTGKCCHHCLRMLIQKGIKRIVHGTIGSTMITSNPLESEASDFMIASNNISITQIDTIAIIDDLNSVINKIKDKVT
jgi:dCMP deaminase